MQTLTAIAITREEDTLRQQALVIPFPLAHVLACAIDHDEDLKAYRAAMVELSHRTSALRETRIRAAERVHALQVVLTEIAKYLPTRNDS